jgi:hypothetical protein
VDFLGASHSLRDGEAELGEGSRCPLLAEVVARLQGKWGSRPWEEKGRGRRLPCARRGRNQQRAPRRAAAKGNGGPSGGDCWRAPSNGDCWRPQSKRGRWERESRGATPWTPASSLLELGPEEMPRPGWSRDGVGEEGDAALRAGAWEKLGGHGRGGSSQRAAVRKKGTGKKKEVAAVVFLGVGVQKCLHLQGEGSYL